MQRSWSRVLEYTLQGLQIRASTGEGIVVREGGKRHCMVRQMGAWRREIELDDAVVSRESAKVTVWTITTAKHNRGV